MNSNFNRQFVLIDFRLIRDRRFLSFLGTSEFATYLVLRCNIWRSVKPHFMGLDELYEQKRVLACSLTRDKIAEVTGTAPDNISRHLSDLVQKGIVKRVRTGRQNVYVLGEWIDVNGDGSYRVEWFYMEGKFGISKSDLTVSDRSETTNSSDQTRRSASDQTRRSASDNNREEPRENPVNNGIIKKLRNLNQPKAKTNYVAEYIFDQFKDNHSKKFYQLVAAKVPEHEIRRAVAEVQKDDNVRDPVKLFVFKMNRYALGK